MTNAEITGLGGERVAGDGFGQTDGFWFVSATDAPGV